jgi:DNA-binding MarR family transcriptional regulator
MRDLTKKNEGNDTVIRIVNAYNEISKCINPVQLLRFDLTSSQIKVLMSFSEKDSFTMTELSKAHFVSVSTMTSMVDRLIHSGFIERNKDKKDRRIVRVSLNADGKKTVKNLIKARKQELEKFYFELSFKEREKFVKSIENVAHYLSTARRSRLFA